jgi:acetyltransferase-like isoleucine patch superfamily enzyme/glycosyltransferase involved in cell wall biosynthesis
MSALRRVLWKTIGQNLVRCSFHNSYRYRVLLLRCFGMRCGRAVRVRRSVRIDKPWNVTADDVSLFGDRVRINADQPIYVGKRCVVSQHAMLITKSGDPKTRGKTDRIGSITIEDDCWIATDIIVMPNSYIEQGVVVGARAMVDGHLPKWSICTGEPAVSRGERILWGQTKGSNIEVVIPVKNEEVNLPFTLKSIYKWADKIWVVDSESTDKTREIAKEYGAEVIVQPWLGYAKQKNWALDNLPIESDWVFILDADEVILPDLRDEMLKIAAEPADQNPISAYNINRYFIFLGKRIRHCGYYPSWNVRFFKRGVARYEEREVHEHMIVDGQQGYLDGNMEHFDRRGLDIYIEKHNHYSMLEAKEILRESKSNDDPVGMTLFGSTIQRRRWIKRYIYPRLPARWLFRFLWMYVLQLGFLDGRNGFRFCMFISSRELLISLKTIELLQEEIQEAIKDAA